MVIDSLEIIYDHNILYAQKIKNWVTYQIIITRLRFQDTIKKNNITRETVCNICNQIKLN